MAMSRRKVVAAFAIAAIVCTALVALVPHATVMSADGGLGFVSDSVLKSAPSFSDLFSVNLNIDHWGYGLKGGPYLWKAMFPRGSMGVGGCSGRWQSPIAVSATSPDTIVDNVHPLELDYPSIGKWVMHRTKNRLYMQRDPAMGMGELGYRGRTYRAHRVELHKPAQHSVNGIIYDMELVITHTSDDGSMANLATFIKADASKEYLHNQLLNSHFDFRMLPKSNGDIKKLQDVFSLSFLVNPANTTFFTYVGSQDTPPCIEGVKWFVMASPQWMNPIDMAAFPSSLVGNNRLEQKSYGRKVYMGNKVTGDGISYNKRAVDQSAQF